MANDKPVDRIGDYEFLDRLAVGGMGEVWRVRHVTLGATYIAKRLRAEHREDEEFLRRFFHEAKLVANLRHPNIVQVFGYEEKEALILMEYVEGMDLDALLRSKWSLEFREKRTVAEVVADTIGYAHREHDLIHRDIKPSNVLIAMSRPGVPIQASRIKLTDFGIARVLSASQRMTMSSGMVMGTVHYMAPEQFEGSADKTSDVYSIGVLYYRLLAGKVPFDGPTAFVIRDKHMKETPPAPHEVDPSVPEADSMIVMKCMEKDPKRRFADSADLYQALMSGSAEPTASAHVDLHGATQVLPSTEGRDAVDATHSTHLVEPTQRVPKGDTGATEATYRQPAATPTERTLMTPGAGQAGAAAAPPQVTERTLRPSAARPKARRLPTSLAGRLGLAAAALAATMVLALLGVLLFAPRFTIRWDTLRSDPLDTPVGVRASVAPRIGLGLIWLSAGTIDQGAPADWSNWATTFGQARVHLSDGLFRQFTITCAPPDGRSVVDFGDASFEQVAKAHGVEIQEDLSRVGAYLDAILVPQNVAAAHSLADLRRCLDRVADLLSRAEGVDFDRTRAEAYHGALDGLLTAADALADSRVEDAQQHLRKAEAHIQNIEPGEMGQLPEDFLFRSTLQQAVTALSDRAETARSLVAGLEARVDSPASIDYSVEKYAKAHVAVAAHLLHAPGRPAFLKLAAEADEEQPSSDLEARVAALDTPPPPVKTAQEFLSKVDALLQNNPPAEQEARLRAKTVALLDQCLTEAEAAEPAPWLEKCFGREQMDFASLAAAYWRQVHRTRFQAAVARCQALAAQRMDAAESALGDEARLGEAQRLLADAHLALDALHTAAHTDEEAKKAARSALGTCCIRQALCRFQAGAASAENEPELRAEVSRLLDRGLDELSGAPTSLREQGEALRRILALQAEAMPALAATRRTNFATRGTATGRAETLLTALAAYKTFRQQMAPYGDHPAYHAALAPFTSLGAPACHGFTLPNAAAYWLLAKAEAACPEARYHEAADLLAAFQAKAEASPLAELLPPELLARGQQVARLAAAFDETAVPAETPMKERWTQLWSRRLEAEPLLEADLPEALGPGALPQSYRGQEEQWNAIHAKMRALRDHYRQRLLAEKQLRKVEKTAAALAQDPKAASPGRLQQCLAALDAFGPKGRFPLLEDHRSRVAALTRQLESLRGKLVDVRAAVAKHLEAGKPNDALDELAARSGVLEAAVERELTRQAVKAWLTEAQARLDAGEPAAAAKALQAIQGHKQVQRHAENEQVAPALEQATALGHYAQGLLALSAGPKGFEAAVESFRKAGACRDAPHLTRQLATLQDATRDKTDEPFHTIDRLQTLAQDDGVHPLLRRTAKATADEVNALIVGRAAETVGKFNQALTDKDWRRYLDKKSLLEADVEHLQAFLAQVERLQVRQPEKPLRTRLRAGNQQVEVVASRVLSFHYKLPDGDTLPLEVEQTIEWTVRHVPAEELTDERWLITNWTEAH
jgi:tRNA A-37 threonylcarbamoyl transferase component Bud32